jgi:hypothetical protein
MRFAAVTILIGACGLLSTGCPGTVPIPYNSAAELQADPAVQAALSTLVSSGQGFSFAAGSSPFDVRGTWRIASGTTTLTQNGLANTPLPAGRMTLSTSNNALSWALSQDDGTTGQSNIAFVEGVATGITLSIFANVTRGAGNCETQNALFFTLVPASDGLSMSGTFLNVHLGSVNGTCAAAGDFSFGSITLQFVDTSIPTLQSLGTVALGNGTPSSVALSPDGSLGFVSLTNGSVLRFSTATRQSESVFVPGQDVTGAGHVGVHGGRVGFATLGENRLRAFGAGAGGGSFANVEAPQLPSQGVFLSIPPLFTGTAASGYAALDFQLGLPAIGYFDAAFGPNPSQLTDVVSFGQDELLQTRLSPGETQIAALLRGEATPGRARFVSLVNIVAKNVAREVDIGSMLLSDLDDQVLEYSANGGRLFVTNGLAIVALQTTPPFDVATMDIRDEVTDRISRYASSFDGDVLLVTIVAADGNADLALLNPGTLQVIDSDAFDDIEIADGGAAAFFADSRTAVVEDGAGHLIPVATLGNVIKPGVAVNAFSGAPNPNIVGMAIGNNVVAVANASERLIYLFRLGA